MTDPGGEIPNLNHFGVGPQVGRDLIGNVTFEQLDLESKAALRQLSKDTPALNRLLEKLLRDGLISPELVQELQSALNEDVLHVLWVVGRHLNEDVAMEFNFAADTFKEVVTEHFPSVTRELSDTVDEIKTATESLRAVIGQTRTQAGVVSPSDGLVTQSAPRGVGKSWSKLKWTCWSSGIGLIAAVILMRTHHGIYATIAGVSILVIAALLQFGRARRA